jgi:hypothetical protein
MIFTPPRLAIELRAIVQNHASTGASPAVGSHRDALDLVLPAFAVVRPDFDVTAPAVRQKVLAVSIGRVSAHLAERE